MRAVFFLIMLGLSLSVYGKTVKLTSPNGMLAVELEINKNIVYHVTFKDKLLLKDSRVGMEFKNQGTDVHIAKVSFCKKEETIAAYLYRVDTIQTVYNELNIRFKEDYGIEFRAYNEGIAYRFYMQKRDSIIIDNEVAEFRFAQNNMSYLSYSTNDKEPFAMAFQNIYNKTLLSEAQDKPIFLPTTVDCGDGVKVTLLESDLENYPGMFVKADSGRLTAVFAGYPTKMDYYPWRQQMYVKERADYIARISGKRVFPWRILAVTERDVDMPINNMVYALASPNRIEDLSWIKSGQVAWDWWNDWGLKGVQFKAGINMETYKYYIDFASQNGISYVILDEGWYDPKSGDMLTVIKDLNLPELVAYAKGKHVSLILWTVFNVLDAQLQEACKIYSEMGIKGFKVDFLDRDDQNAVEMVYRITETAAKYKIMLDLHGIYKPTGLNRTYPNVINFEAVFGMEEMKWNEDNKDMPRYDVTFPFIRMMSGPVDYTPGAMRNATKKDYKPIYYNPMSMGTRCHQLATYVVYDSPLTMLCDAPSNYMLEQQCTELITSIPTQVDETRILCGELGEYIVTARRKGDNWYIGGLTNWNERDLHIDFSFLPQGKPYLMTIFKDGVNANKQATDYIVNRGEICAKDVADIHLASGGGFVIKLQLHE